MVGWNQRRRRGRWHGSLTRDPIYAVLILLVGAIGVRLNAPLDALGFILAGTLVAAAFARPLIQLVLDRGESARLDVNLAYLGAAVLTATLAVATNFLPSTQLETASASTRPEAGSTFTCQVASIHDGDTLRCVDGIRVRLHAVAAREIDETCSPGHPCPEASAASARQALVDLAGGETLSCARTGTSYDRVTAICRNSRGVEINCGMIRSGTAVVWEKFNREEPICRT